MYNDENSTAYLSGESYTVTYYTWITDEAWDEITSSLTGSETFTNTATVDMGDEEDLTGTGSKTVTSDSFIWKEDITQHESPTSNIVIDANGRNTNILSYQIDVNPYAMQLVSEEGATLTLTDRISTNMDLDTSGDGVIVEYEAPDGSFINIKEVTDPELIDLFKDIKVSYNDDTRYVTIDNIPDEIHFRMTYHTVVRAQGTDIFENTAVLTGGGSHSASTHEEHTIQKSSGNISGDTANISLRKIDENDISTKIPGATFEFYECKLANDKDWKSDVEVPVTTDGESDSLVTEPHFNFNRIEAAVPNPWTGYSGNGETEQLLADFKITDTHRVGDPVQSGSDGIVTIPGVLKEETLYYWIETATADGYEAELNVRHYFIVYQVEEDGELLVAPTTEFDSEGKALKVWETRQWRGWALDDAAQAANGITVASLAADNTWTVNNQREEYTSVSATKEWKGDYDNFYETRPEEGIQLKLIQISSDGTEKQYGPVIPINVDDEGNWPTYVWQKLPKAGTNNSEEAVTYTYRVEEESISGYTVEYTVDGEEQPETGVVSGEVTVTNTLIPTKTNISVEKVFDQDGTEYPDQILVYLYEITTYADGTSNKVQRASQALTAAGDWKYTWRNLPTKDDDGNALTYTVVEAPVGDGFSYTVSYSDNGEGITGNTADDPLVITNTENGLEITKKFTGDIERLLGDSETAAEMRSQITFTVTDGQESHIVTFSM